MCVECTPLACLSLDAGCSDQTSMLSVPPLPSPPPHACDPQAREDVSELKSNLSKANVEAQSLAAKLSSSEGQCVKLAHQLDLLRAEMAALGRELDAERSSNKHLQEDATKAAASSAAQREKLQVPGWRPAWSLRAPRRRAGSLDEDQLS